MRRCCYVAVVRGGDQSMHSRGAAVASSDVSKKSERGERVYVLPSTIVILIWEVHCALQRLSECVLLRTFYALPTRSYTSRRFGIRQQPHT
jgi:hypothetical protein